MDSLRLRLATEPDIPALVELRRALALEDAPDSESALSKSYDDEAPAFFSKAIKSGRWQMWVAELEGEIVSQLSVALVDKVPSPTREHERIAYLTNVYTVPERRNQGIAGAILKRAQEAAREANAELVFVWPSIESTPFYRRAGFDAPDDILVWHAD